MRRPSGRSIRVSGDIRKRVANLALTLRAASRQEVIDKSLDRLEQSLFWEGFDEEARAYLDAFPGEARERERFAGTTADRSNRSKTVSSKTHDRPRR